MLHRFKCLDLISKKVLVEKLGDPAPTYHPMATDYVQPMLQQTTLTSARVHRAHHRLENSIFKPTLLRRPSERVTSAADQPPIAGTLAGQCR